MKFNMKLIFNYQNFIILASVLPIVVFGLITYHSLKNETIDATFRHLEKVNQQKLLLTKEYFNQVEFDTLNLSKTISFFEKQARNHISNIQTIQKNHLLNYYNSLEKDVVSLSKKDIFQYIYVFLTKGKSVNTEYITAINKHIEALNLKSFYMVNSKGQIVYSNKEDYVNKNIKALSYKLYQEWDTVKVTKHSGKDSVRIINHGYGELSKEYKQYIINPFKDVDGYIVLEVNQEDIQKVIENTASLGKTAETYLVSKDDAKTYLASKRRIKNGSIGDRKNGKYIELGFFKDGTSIKYGSLGNLELVGYMPVKIKNTTLSMQTTVRYKEIISPDIEDSDFFEQFMLDYNYRNIMLIDSTGDIFYSATKEDDYNTNIFTGKYSKTNLAQAVKKAVESQKYVLTDVGLYGASPEKIAQFGVNPVFNASGRLEYLAVIQLGVDGLTKKLLKYQDKYDTSETYIVGTDKLLRTDSVLSSSVYNVLRSYMNSITINTQAVREATDGTSKQGIVQDYRGKDVLSTYNQLLINGLEWIILSEIDLEEVNQSIKSLKYNILLFVVISIFVVIIIMYIVTYSKQRNDEELKYNATHDNLTGLPNRNFFLEFLLYRLETAKRFNKQGALLFIDLDKFKVVNDSYGHNTGDYVLKQVASRLSKIVRAEDFIARVGGDEFTLTVNSFETLKDVDILCNKIVRAISEPIYHEDRAYKIGISIGIATFPQDSLDAQELLQFADTAMFRTKENGRNGFTYYDKNMTEESLRIARVENELRHAISHNELVLYYQPQIDIKRKKIVSVEALVRWNHPRDGLIMPNDFIPIAEESDLIIDLGYWVTREACRTFKEWKDNGVEIESIAVNMSTKQLQCTRCIEDMQTILDELDFKAQWLELEITENTLISNLESTLDNINILKNMGINFSIDDFGTGYSSLSYLKSLQIATLKIDRAFIKDILVNKDDKTIVAAIIAMGHTLNYKIVAEGVETMDAVRILEKLSCDLIQGYYYSKPLDETSILRYIEKFKV